MPTMPTTKNKKNKKTDKLLNIKKQNTMAKALTNTDFKFENQTKVYHGKVRDVYTIGNDKLVMVATDRISAFDVVLPKGIPYIPR